MAEFTSKLGSSDSIVGQTQMLGLLGNPTVIVTASSTLTLTQLASAQLANNQALGYMSFEWNLDYRPSNNKHIRW